MVTITDMKIKIIVRRLSSLAFGAMGLFWGYIVMGDKLGYILPREVLNFYQSGWFFIVFLLVATVFLISQYRR